MNKVSIIVPIYNVEKYLVRCISSLVNQDYSNIEIILVDDGSTDNSSTIAKHFSENSPNVNYYYKKNGGLSDARNFGIKKATGEYLMFIDSDDYIDFDTVSKLVELSNKNNSEITCCGKYIEDENGKYYFKNVLKNEKIYNREDALSHMLTFDEIDTSACDKLFAKELFEDISFPVGRFYEDLATIYKVFEKAKSISHIGNAKYHYVQRDGSIINSKFNEEKHMQYVKTSEKIYNHYIGNTNLVQYAYSNYILAVMDTILVMVEKRECKKNKSIYNELINIIRDNIKKIKNSKILKSKRILIYLINFRLCKTANFLRKIYKKIR